MSNISHIVDYPEYNSSIYHFWNHLRVLIRIHCLKLPENETIIKMECGRYMNFSNRVGKCARFGSIIRKARNFARYNFSDDAQQQQNRWELKRKP